MKTPRIHTFRGTPLLIAFLALVAALAAGCNFPFKKQFSFPHQVHSQESACEACHPAARRAAHEDCVKCHKIDSPERRDRCGPCHGEKQTASPAMSEQYADVNFRHESHSGTVCAKCHATVSWGVERSDATLPKMSLCLECHKNTDDQSCAYCHTTVRREVPPVNHNSVWLPSHGLMAFKNDRSCINCHGLSGCDDCHKEKRPKNHTLPWKNSQHGTSALFDRRSCAVCHRADYCQDCHSTRPPSHSAPNYRIPLNLSQGHAASVRERGGPRSCVACHAKGFCLECHPGGV